MTTCRSRGLSESRVIAPWNSWHSVYPALWVPVHGFWRASPATMPGMGPVRRLQSSDDTVRDDLVRCDEPDPADPAARGLPEDVTEGLTHGGTPYRGGCHGGNLCGCPSLGLATIQIRAGMEGRASACRCLGCETIQIRPRRIVPLHEPPALAPAQPARASARGLLRRGLAAEPAAPRRAVMRGKPPYLDAEPV